MILLIFYQVKNNSCKFPCKQLSVINRSYSPDYPKSAKLLFPQLKYYCFNSMFSCRNNKTRRTAWRKSLELISSSGFPGGEKLFARQTNLTLQNESLFYGLSQEIFKHRPNTAGNLFITLYYLKHFLYKKLSFLSRDKHLYVEYLFFRVLLLKSLFR